MTAGLKASITQEQFFSSFFLFFKDHGSLLLAMRSLRSQSVKGDSGERTCCSLDGL